MSDVSNLHKEVNPKLWLGSANGFGGLLQELFAYQK